MTTKETEFNKYKQVKEYKQNIKILSSALLKKVSFWPHIA